MTVVDTNVIAYLLIPGEYTQHAEAALLKDPDWVAPHLWRSEFRSVLSLYVRKMKMPFEYALSLADEAEDMLSGKEYQVSSARVLKLCSQSSRSAYDCEFVALASLLDVPLITTDSEILKEFPSLVISLSTFGAR